MMGLGGDNRRRDTNERAHPARRRTASGRLFDRAAQTLRRNPTESD